MPFGTPDKVELGTAALYGTSVLEGEWRSSRIYGLTGEALLNFGVLGAIAVYAVFGYAVKNLDASYLVALRARRLSTSHVTVPLGVVALILVLGSDLDNVLWFLAKQGGLLLVALALALEVPRGLEEGTQRIRREVVFCSKGRGK